MDESVIESMFSYYDERSGEYEEIYTLGGGPASISDSTVYREEALSVSRLLPQHVGGRLVDLACGTGFWLPSYMASCSRMTLVDQSARMLGECGKKVNDLGLAERCALIRCDLFNHPFKARIFDSAFSGFLLSHLDEPGERRFFGLLRRILVPGGRLVIVDSIWNSERASVREKEGLQTRTLNDGRSFTVYKRYFTPQEVVDIGGREGFTMKVLHAGRAFFAVGGTQTSAL